MVNTIDLFNVEHYIQDLSHWQEKIEEFVDNYDYSFYKNNRNANPTKVKQNNWISKLAEVGVAQYLMKQGYPWVEPDFRIYTKKDKSWNADLPYDNYGYPNIHVKSCDKSTCDYLRKNSNDDYSWTFQYANKNGRGGKDDIFGTDDEVALVYVPEMASRWIRLVSIIPFGTIKPLLKDPISPRLKGIKKCLYYKDLMNESS